MICPLCHETNDHKAVFCKCGFRFVVPADDLENWFSEIRSLLENGYLSAETPWKQSGKSVVF
jgi:hypothetical protein